MNTKLAESLAEAVVSLKEMKSYPLQAQKLHNYLNHAQSGIGNRFLRLLQQNQSKSS